MRVANQNITGNRSLAVACSQCDAIIITPSNWSREGFIRSGAPADRVIVVPHGIDPAIFHPVSPERKSELRRELQWDGFMFLSLGAMSHNKGMGNLLKALAIVAQKHPHVRLFLKGIAALFRSRELFQKQTEQLTQAEIALIEPRLKFVDMTLNFAQMAALYQAADAYVSPYRA